MTRALQSKAYLVAPQGAAGHAPLYAALNATEAGALQAVASATGINAASLTVWGGLSRNMVRNLKLKPGKVLRI